MILSDDELSRVVNNSDDEEQSRSRWRLANAVELPVFLVFFGLSMGGAVIGNLILYRTCVHSLHHEAQECRSFLSPEALNHTQELEKAVQEYAAFVGTVKAVLEALGPAILSIFLGGWSDKHGRKPLLVWPILGMTFSSMLTVVYSMVDSMNAWWITATIIPFSLSGGYCAMIIGTMCYVSDISNDKTKGLSFILLQATIAVSTTFGGLASPYLLKAVGVVYLLLIQAALYTIAYAFTNIFIEESMKEAEQGTILTVFYYSHAKEMITTCFKEKPNYGRPILLLTIAASGLSIFTIYGSTSLVYMFTRTKIQWTMKDYTTFSAISSAMWFAGSFLGIAVLQKRLRISDLTFTGIAFFSCIVEYTIKAFATKTWHMYLGSTISLFGTISGPLIRTFLSKIVPSEDMAKVFGFVGSSESVVPLLSPLVYNALYAGTVFTFPGAVMLLTAFINVICLVFILIVKYLRKKAASGYQYIGTEES